MSAIKKIKKDEWIPLHDLSDYEGTLLKLKKEIDKLISLHGEKSIIRVDAGYNNVSFDLKIKK